MFSFFLYKPDMDEKVTPAYLLQFHKIKFTDHINLHGPSEIRGARMNALTTASTCVPSVHQKEKESDP
jgi:hypothetical protein